jgi:hypothetical protein
MVDKNKVRGKWVSTRMISREVVERREAEVAQLSMSRCSDHHFVARARRSRCSMYGATVYSDGSQSKIDSAMHIERYVSGWSSKPHEMWRAGLRRVGRLLAHETVEVCAGQAGGGLELDDV